MSPTWTYFAQDLASGQIVADLPLTGVRFTRTLNGHGPMSGSLNLGALSSLRRVTLLDAIDPGRRAIYAEADGQLIWGGPVWVEGDDGPVQIQAQEWGSAFASMILQSDRTYTATDQLSIARDLIAAPQAGPGGTTIRVGAGVETSGVLRDRTYMTGDLPVIGDLFSALANVEDGFDYAWPVEYDEGGLPRGRLLLGYPRLGSADPSIVIDMPRSIGFTRDAAALAVTSFAAGQKPAGGSDVPVAVATDTALLDAGYLPLHKVTSYTDVVDPTTLQAHADADQKASGGTLATVTVTVSISEVLTNGVQPGDPALCRFTGPRFPAGDDVDAVPGTDPITTMVPGGDDYLDLYADLYGGVLTPVVTPGTPPRPAGSRGAGFEAILRITQIDYDPGAGVAALTLAPRITFGGKVPTAADDSTSLARLSREIRQLSTST